MAITKSHETGNISIPKDRCAIGELGVYIDLNVVADCIGTLTIHDVIKSEFDFEDAWSSLSRVITILRAIEEAKND